MKWFIKCITRDFATFTGRARRKEFWYFILFYLIFTLVGVALDSVIFGFNAMFHPIEWLITLFLIVPMLAVTVRRFHDTAHSGWPLLWYYIVSFVWMIALIISLLPTIGVIENDPAAILHSTFFYVLSIGGLVFLVWEIVFIVWCCLPGTEGNNKYGEDPLRELKVEN